MEERSYTRIFKSTFIIGSAELVNMVNGLIRTKILAVLLGPVGIGLIGLLNSITAIIGNLINIGVSS
ncbi:MAG: hypothetical protein PHN75_11740, partial [Syntrophales bacterium]|nr:hypothetical protein [Syntrophales bacterium]